MKTQSRIHNQGGQIIVEYILMLVVVLTASFMIQKWLRDTKIVQNFTVQPWEKLNGMIQCGAWAKCGVETPAPLHSNHSGRVLSLDTATL